ncbi:hypothetical protein E4T47_09105 [Aureobasidium subglaciale]|nr:hypothetical protein E4T47_09105 [Aureobasidium subglaciale]
MTDTPSTNGHTRILPTASDLLTRCQLLLSELETFKEYLKTRKQDSSVEIAHFRNTVKSEHRTLSRLADNEDVEATQHTVNSSNLPFLEQVWGVVKGQTGLQAMQKRFYWQEAGQKRGMKKRNSALVDIVAGDGLEWFKVSLLTNNRLLFDKAKQGWEDASSSEEEDEDGEEKTQDGKKEEDEDNDVPLVKMTKDLVRAAKEVKIRTRSPTITLVLPKLREGEVAEIDKILDQLRALGVKLLTSTSISSPPPFNTVMPHLLTNPFASFTPTLNIDCTILLALVSDFSHCSVTTEPWFHRALTRQVEIEDEENLLPNLLYPALANAELSVFLYGWDRGITTITSNRTVVKQIENVLAKEAGGEGEWPRVWLCPTARSLVGKEKGRRD